MSLISDLLAGAHDIRSIGVNVNTALAGAGTSLPDLGKAAEAMFKDLESNPAPVLAKIAADGLEMAFPAFAMFIAIGLAISQDPSFRPADVNDLVFKRSDGNDMDRDI